MADDITSLYIGERSIRIAKARNMGGKLEILALAKQNDAPAFYEFNTDKIIEEEASTIKRLFDLYKIKKKSIHIVVPDAYSFAQIISMPRLKEKELLSAIKYQADQFIPMPIGETSLDIEILSENAIDEKFLVLVVAVPQSLVTKLEKVSEQIGSYPESIETELCAAGKFFSQFYIPQDRVGGSIFINVGYSATSLYYFDHRFRLLIDNHVCQVGYALFLRESQADINIDEAKAIDLLKNVGFADNSSVDLKQILKPSFDVLTNELQKFVSSIKSKFKIETISQIYLYNYANNIAHLDSELERATSIPSALYQYGANVKRTPVVEPFIDDLPSFIDTIGGSL